MDQNRDQCKKCYCARCFFPIDEEDKVDIEGQSFHKGCCMCCVCRKIPISIKMFYGHVFCADCFKEHVMARFRGEGPRMHSNSWWMQWGPQMGPQMRRDCECGGMKPEDCTPEDPSKRTCFCSRCLQPVDETKVTIGDQCFHPQCAKCFFCQRVPTTTPKIYYGQLFCEDCFNRHVLSRNKDNPSEFFRNCFEQWNSPQFAYQMKQFMSTGKSASPMVFMMGQPPVCRCGCGGGPQSVWFPPTEAKRCA